VLFAAGTSNEVLESVIGMGYDLASSAPVKRRALAAGGGSDPFRTIDGLRYWWRNDQFGEVVPHHELRWECHLSFEERAFDWGPALYRYLAPVASEASERSLIERGVIKPLGFRYVGIKRAAQLAGQTPA
jgi:hypothetical protein